MSRALVPCFGTTLVLVALLGGSARADQVVPWSYSWDATPSVLTADPPGTGTITLTPNPGTSMQNTDDVLAALVSAASAAPAGRPDHFTAQKFTLSLNLEDLASQATHTFAFTQQLDGTLSSYTVKALTPLTQSFTLGKSLYTVALDPLPPLTPSPAGQTCGNGVHAEVSVEPPAAHNPEPTTLVLAALGMAGGGLFLRRMRRPG